MGEGVTTGGLAAATWCPSGHGTLEWKPRSEGRGQFCTDYRPPGSSLDSRSYHRVSFLCGHCHSPLTRVF